MHGSEGLSRLAACRCATLWCHVRIVETVRIVQRRIGVGKETSDPGPIGGVFGQFEARFLTVSASKVRPICAREARDAQAWHCWIASGLGASASPCYRRLVQSHPAVHHRLTFTLTQLVTPGKRGNLAPVRDAGRLGQGATIGAGTSLGRGQIHIVCKSRTVDDGAV